jgi:hypothetical protein
MQFSLIIPNYPVVQFSGRKKTPQKALKSPYISKKRQPEPVASKVALPNPTHLLLIQKLLMVKLVNAKIAPVQTLGTAKPSSENPVIPNYPTVSRSSSQVEITAPSLESRDQILIFLKTLEGFQENPVHKTDATQPAYLLDDVPVSLEIVSPKTTFDANA